MSRPTNSPPDVSLVYAIGRVNQGIVRELREQLRRWQLSVPEFTALSVLEHRPDLSNAQLARRTMVTPQTMIEILAELERRELVERFDDATHGRIRRARLTASGTRILIEARPVVQWIEDEMLDGVDPRERALLLSAMATAMEKLRPGLSSSPPGE